MINIYEPNIKKYSEKAIETIKSGWISNKGENINFFTKKLC